MVYYRSGYRPRTGRRYNKYKPYGRRYNKSGWMSTAGKALRVATRVASMLNTEYKVYDNNAGTGGLSITNDAAPTIQGRTSFITLNNVPLGDDMNQRNGRSIRLKSFYIRLNPKLDSTLDHVNIRVLLVMYRGQATPTLPTPNDVWVVPTAASQWVRSFRDVMGQNTKSYRVLMDKSFTMDRDYKSELQIDKYVKLNTHQKFRDTYDQGTIWLCVMYDNLDADGKFDIPWQSRMRYIDN